MSAAEFLSDRAQLALLSPIVSPRHRSAARPTAAYSSLSTGRSPKAWGTTVVRRRASRKSRSSSFVACIAHLRFPLDDNRC
jgi:hypothetical protein